jgi:hypothetical protein
MAELQMREQRFNLAHRLIHWDIAFTMLFILLTNLLRIGWMNKDRVGNIIQQNQRKAHNGINAKDASCMGKAIRESMWNWHIWPVTICFPVALKCFRV